MWRPTWQPCGSSCASMGPPLGQARRGIGQGAGPIAQAHLDRPNTRGPRDRTEEDLPREPAKETRRDERAATRALPAKLVVPSPRPTAACFCFARTAAAAAAAEQKVKEANPAMGASHNHHLRGTFKITDGGENVRLKYASSSMQGWCAKMEDACAVVPDLDGATSFFGVYDGHGGAEVALFCARQVHIELRSHPNYQNNLNNAMRSVFFRMDELLQQSNQWMELLNPSDGSSWIQNIMRALFANHWPFTKATPYIAPQYMGSTACVAVIKGSRITVANIGDAHCVASKNGQAIELSTAHKAFERDESRRIRRAGGRVWMDKIVLVVGPQIPLLGIRVIKGALATSRVIGDFAFKKNKNLPPEEQMAICDPHLHSMEITNDIKFLVMASHGIWECMKSQDVVDFVQQEFESGETDLRVICERLVDRSVPSSENSTAILVQFKHRVPTATDGEGSCKDAETVARALAFLKDKQKEIARDKQEEMAKGSKSS